MERVGDVIGCLLGILFAAVLIRWFLKGWW